MEKSTLIITHLIRAWPADVTRLAVGVRAGVGRWGGRAEQLQIAAAQRKGEDGGARKRIEWRRRLGTLAVWGARHWNLEGGGRAIHCSEPVRFRPRLKKEK
jgi:hypothetical protein